MSDDILGGAGAGGDGGTPDGAGGDNTGGQGGTGFPDHAPEWIRGIEGIDPEITGDPSLQAVKDIPNLVKSFVNAQKLIGKDKVVIPNENSGEEEWQNFFSKIGKPEALDKYELSKLDGLDESFLDGFKQAAFEANLLPKQAQKVMEWMHEHESKMDEQYFNQIKETQQKELNDLKTEWGDAWQENVAQANAALSEFGGEEFTKFLKESGLGNNPNMIRFMHGLGSKLNKEDNLGNNRPSGGGKISRDEAQKMINEIMSSKDDAYHNAMHADHHRRVEEVNKLFQML